MAETLAELKDFINPTACLWFYLVVFFNDRWILFCSGGNICLAKVKQGFLCLSSQEQFLKSCHLRISLIIIAIVMLLGIR